MSTETPQPKSVLVLRFSSAGDIVLTTPAIDALRKAWPGTRIVYAVKKNFAVLVRNNPNIDEVVELAPDESLFAFGKRLRALRCETLLDIHGKARCRILRMLVPTPGKRVVWNKRPWMDNVWVRMLRVRTYRAAMPISDRYHVAVEELVGRPLPRGELRHFLGSNDQEEARTALAAAGVDHAKPLLGMSPGANWETKRWPSDRYGEIARRALARGYQVVLTGSAAEAHLGAPIRAAAPGTVDLIGKLTLSSLAGTISLCKAYVANDSGPMHMSRALGVPTLTFFGSTDPKQFEFDGHGLLYAGTECSPCSFYGLPRCPKGHFKCMLDLDVERAWGVLEPLLHGRRVGFVHA